MLQEDQVKGNWGNTLSEYGICLVEKMGVFSQIGKLSLS